MKGLFGRRNDAQTPSEEQVMRALSTVKEPELGGDLVSRKMIKDLKIEDGVISLTIELTTPACPLKDQIESEVRAALQAIPNVEINDIRIEWTSNVRAVHGGLPNKSPIPGVSNVIAVASGKGGVGKSTVAVNLAVALAQDGARVGLLDADIYGPSAPLMLGVNDRPAVTPQKKIIPLEAHGIKVMSVGYLIDASQPLVWRGPMISSMLRQFLFDVDWGELDYLIVDLPPGTGDIQLTLVQACPLSGAVIVTTPQDVALADAIKGVEMFRKLDTPILGIVENMSYFCCPHCGERSDIFSHGGAVRASERLGVPFLGEVPLSLAIREGGDTGRPAVTSDSQDAQAEAFKKIARLMAGRLSVEAFAAPVG
ncbi:MAG: iron-sulfur cluster carrier protein [Herpetosiphonaceae bacterium]|nr:MAG: iron-sulfur cluster carrier protein [Herpetosiphonaceae bacterium]